MTTELVMPEDPKEIQESGNSLEKMANELVIDSDESYQVGANLLVQINTVMKKVKPELDKPRAAAWAHYQDMLTWVDKHFGPYERAKKKVAGMVGAWDLAIAQKRQKEALAAQAKADKETREKREAEIQAARERKDKEAVAALKSAPIPMASIQVKTAAPTKVEGVNTRFKWALDQVINVDALPRRWLIANEKAINGTVEDLGEKHGIPGITIKQVPITSGRTK